MQAVAKWILQFWELPVAIGVVTLFAIGILSRAGWLGYACGLVLCTGVVLNALAIAFNAGYMPVAVDLERAPETCRDHYKAIDGTTRLAVLGDWINFGSCLISPGDVLIVLGFVGGIAARLVRVW